jgi:tetratricopeptide (TPR) repeat protein
LAFSRDGERLVSAGDDRTVRVWDTGTGQQLLSLEGHGGAVCSLAFGPDDRLIASASDDGTVKVWDARPPSPELAARRQAVALLASFAKGGRGAAVSLPAVRDDPTLSEAARQEALRLADTYNRCLVHTAAADLVRTLGFEGLPRGDLYQAVRTKPGLTESVRQEALALARGFVENPVFQNQAAWNRVCQPDRKEDRAAYELALRQAQAAARLAPENGAYLTTVAMAHYRLGNYEEAAEALAQAGEMIADKDDAAAPARLAFLAMTRHRLKDTEGARAVLGELRVLMQRPQWTRRKDAQGFLAEAESLLTGP